MSVKRVQRYGGQAEALLATDWHVALPKEFFRVWSDRAEGHLVRITRIDATTPATPLAHKFHLVGWAQVGANESVGEAR